MKSTNRKIFFQKAFIFVFSFFLCWLVTFQLWEPDEIFNPASLPEGFCPFKPLRNVKNNCFLNTAMQLFFLMNLNSSNYLVESLEETHIPSYQNTYIQDYDGINRLKGLNRLMDLYKEIYVEHKSGFSEKRMKPFLDLIQNGFMKLGRFEDSIEVAQYILQLISKFYLVDPLFSLGYQFQLNIGGMVQLDHSVLTLVDVKDDDTGHRDVSWASKTQLERFLAGMDLAVQGKKDNDLSVLGDFIGFKQYLLVYSNELLRVENLGQIEAVEISAGVDGSRKSEKFRLVYMAMCRSNKKSKGQSREHGSGTLYRGR